MKPERSLLLAFDTSVWIAWIEQKPEFLGLVRPLFEELGAGRLGTVTSVLGLLEILTGAFRRGDDHLARRTEEALTHMDGSTLAPVTPAVARVAARLRAAHGLRTPDAVHVATAILADAAAFVTMDRRLARVKEIPVRVLRPAASKRPRR